jgi:hypothetical protein
MNFKKSQPVRFVQRMLNEMRYLVAVRAEAARAYPMKSAGRLE